MNLNIRKNLGRLAQSVQDTGITVKNGVLNTGHRVSVILSRINTVEGLVPLTKSVPADIRLAQRFNIRIFDKALPEFEALKDLLYAFSLIPNIKDNYIKIETNEDGSIKKKFYIPRYKGGYDWNKILVLFGDFCELGYWLKKVKIIDSYPILSNLSKNYGYVKVFPWINGKKYSVDDVPGLQAVNTKLKDFAIFIACGIYFSRVSDVLASRHTWEGRCKIAGNAGKMFLIFFGRMWAPLDNWKGFAFAVADCFTQNDSFLGYIIKTEKARYGRISSPLDIN